MLFVAAAIEAFWSGSSVPSAVKRGVGATLFLLLSVYVALVGRRRDGDAGSWGAS
jgi:hypothetical protein